MYRFLQIFIYLSAVISPLRSTGEKLDKYIYMLKRNEIKNYEESKHQFFLNDETSQYFMSKTYKEEIVDLYLQLLKRNEIRYQIYSFYHPIQNNLQYIQKSSHLYNLLRLMPKGGNLHLHEYQELDRSKLIDLLTESIDYEYLYVCDQIDDCKNINYFLNYFKGNENDIPKGWTKFSESKLKKQDLVDKTTLIGILNGLNSSSVNYDFSEFVWKMAINNNIFLTYQSVSEYKTVRYRYLKAVLDAALDENVQLIEFRRPVFGNLWYYQEDGKIGHVSANDELDELRKLKNEYIDKNPKFIDFSFIIFGLRSLKNKEIDNAVDLAIEYNKNHPDLVKGFDLVEEEDKGHTLLYHSDSLIKAYNYAKKESNGTFKLYLHNGETNWSENQQIYRDDNDNVPTLENIYDAIVLEPGRLGHGLGFSKHPQIYETLIKNDIAIELCLTSNHLLQYTPDLRNHPGLNFYRSGIPVVLAGDDPGTFGYNELTIEYYLASLAWHLNLIDLRNLAINSIKYSSLSIEEKYNAFMKWKNEWEKFIFSTYDLVCEKHQVDFYETESIEIKNILPSYSYFNITTNITLYGEGFQNTFCKNIICKFGEIETRGYLIKLNEIICKSPLSSKSHENLSFKILIFNDDGNFSQEIETSFNFSIMIEPKSG